MGYVGEPCPGHDDYLGRLAIPYFTKTGVVAFKFRVIPEITGSDRPKYLGLPGATPRLFNAHALLDSPFGDTAVICEGELDPIVVQDVTGLASVGVPGVDAWSPWWARLFAGVRTYMIPDHDPKNERGERPGDRLRASVLSTLPSTTIIRLPEGMDASEYVAAEGPDALREKFGEISNDRKPA